MSLSRKKVLTRSRFAGLFILLIFLMTACVPVSNYGKEAAVPATAMDGQAPDSGEKAAGEYLLDEPALTADIPAGAAEGGIAAPEPEPAPEEGLTQGVEQAAGAERSTEQSGNTVQGTEQSGNTVQGTEKGQSIMTALPSVRPADNNAEQSPTVTAATYVPKSSKKVSIPVLNYHSVAIDPGNIVVISPDKLAAQMAYLHEQGFTPLSLETFIRLLEGDSSGQAPEKPVLLTFDDGYIDNYEQAMPILAQYGFPATLFVSPGMTEHDGYLNWEQIQKLKEAGWDIQPHGMSHPHLPRLTADEQAYEIVEARKQIEAKLGTKADIFCYPYGEFNKTTLKLLKQHGFRYAFTIEQGLATKQQPPFQLKRIFVNGEESLKTFAAKLPKTK